jgi:hypothetical protein
MQDMIKKLSDKIDQYPNRNIILFIFLIVWLLVNLTQAAFTELHPDEAYYWMYSRKLAWGYFDHPPMVAILVKAGYFFLHNELGVRLFHSLTGIGTIFIIYKIMEEYISKISVFILLTCSILIVHSHMGSFLAIPDIPVVFFAALFFLVYKRYLTCDSWELALMLGVIGAAMLYSKYHGVLVLFFTLLSNIKILRRLTFWIVPVVICLLLLPHLFWQIDNNFPTLQYHLVSRSSSYKLDYTISYVFGQLLMAGPFVGIIILFQAFKPIQGSELFIKTLRYNLIGFLAFFFCMSFKGRVEPHWTAIGYIPAVVLATINIEKNNQAFKWIRILFVPTMVLFLFVRLALVFQILPGSVKLDDDFHNWDKWAKEIKKFANGRYVVFVNSFQQPSKYSFYTHGDFSHSLNSIHYRKNQFDIWHGEDSIQGKNILLVGAYKQHDSISTSAGIFRVRKINNFHSYFHVKIKPEILRVRSKINSPIGLKLTIENNSQDTLKFESSDIRYLPCLASTFYNYRRFGPLQDLDTLKYCIPPNQARKTELTILAPELPGKYLCYLSIINDQLLPPFNARPIEIDVFQ